MSRRVPLPLAEPIEITSGSDDEPVRGAPPARPPPEEDAGAFLERILVQQMRENAWRSAGGARNAASVPVPSGVNNDDDDDADQAPRRRDRAVTPDVERIPGQTHVAAAAASGPPPPVPAELPPVRVSPLTIPYRRGDPTSVAARRAHREAVFLADPTKGVTLNVLDPAAVRERDMAVAAANEMRVTRGLRSLLRQLTAMPPDQRLLLAKHWAWGDLEAARRAAWRQPQAKFSVTSEADGDWPDAVPFVLPQKKASLGVATVARLREEAWKQYLGRHADAPVLFSDPEYRAMHWPPLAEGDLAAVQEARDLLGDRAAPLVPSAPSRADPDDDFDFRPSSAVDSVEAEDELVAAGQQNPFALKMPRTFDEAREQAALHERVLAEQNDPAAALEMLFPGIKSPTLATHAGGHFKKRSLLQDRLFGTLSPMSPATAAVPSGRLVLSPLVHDTLRAQQMLDTADAAVVRSAQPKVPASRKAKPLAGEYADDAVDEGDMMDYCLRTAEAQLTRMAEASGDPAKFWSNSDHQLGAAIEAVRDDSNTAWFAANDRGAGWARHMRAYKGPFSYDWASYGLRERVRADAAQSSEGRPNSYYCGLRNKSVVDLASVTCRAALIKNATLPLTFEQRQKNPRLLYQEGMKLGVFEGNLVLLTPPDFLMPDIQKVMSSGLAGRVGLSSSATGEHVTSIDEVIDFTWLLHLHYAAVCPLCGFGEASRDATFGSTPAERGGRRWQQMEQLVGQSQLRRFTFAFTHLSALAQGQFAAPFPTSALRVGKARKNIVLTIDRVVASSTAKLAELAADLEILFVRFVWLYLCSLYDVPARLAAPAESEAPSVRTTWSVDLCVGMSGGEYVRPSGTIGGPVTYTIPSSGASHSQRGILIPLTEPQGGQKLVALGLLCGVHGIGVESGAREIGIVAAQTSAKDQAGLCDQVSAWLDFVARHVYGIVAPPLPDESIGLTCLAAALASPLAIAGLYPHFAFTEKFEVNCVAQALMYDPSLLDFPQDRTFGVTPHDVTPLLQLHLSVPRAVAHRQVTAPVYNPALLPNGDPALLPANVFVSSSVLRHLQSWFCMSSDTTQHMERAKQLFLLVTGRLLPFRDILALPESVMVSALLRSMTMALRRPCKSTWGLAPLCFVVDFAWPQHFDVQRQLLEDVCGVPALTVEQTGVAALRSLFEFNHLLSIMTSERNSIFDFVTANAVFNHA